MCSVVSNSLRLHGLQPTRLLVAWNFPSKNTGVGCYFLLQGIYPGPGIKPASLASAALAGGFFTTVPCGKPTSTPTTQVTVSQYNSPVKETRVSWINTMTLTLWQGKHQMNVEHCKDETEVLVCSQLSWLCSFPWGGLVYHGCKQQPLGMHAACCLSGLP